MEDQTRDSITRGDPGHAALQPLATRIPPQDRCRRGALDAPVAIRALKRSACEKYGVESLAPDTQDELLS